MTTRTRRPTQKEVALHAGVSQAVVSHVLTGRGNIGVTSSTRERVLQAMRDLSYTPNMAAQRLAGGQTHILSVFTYDAVFPVEGDFYYPFLIGIEQEAEKQNYDLLLHTRSADANGKRSIMQDGVNCLRLADGAVLLGYLNDERRAELDSVVEDGFPVVFIGRRDLAGERLSYVAANYEEATGEVVRHLQELGHTQFLYIGGSSRHESVNARVQGYADALPEGALIYVQQGDITPAWLRAQRDLGITAFVLESDQLTYAFQAAAEALGLTAPQDFSFAVLGDPLSFGAGLLPWTMFTIPRHEMGRAAIRLLVQLINAEDLPSPQRITLPCTFCPGTTTGPVPIQI